MIRYATLALLTAIVLPNAAFAQQGPPTKFSPEQERAEYCIDVAQQRDKLNGYALSLQQQVTKLSNDLKEAQDKLKGTEDAYDAYKKAHPAEPEKSK